MSSAAALLVMLNNYVHDVATGLLLLSALWLSWSSADLGPRPSSELLAVFRRSYRRCVRFVIGSLVVIVLTGAVRTHYFFEVEWQPARARGVVPVLVAKHVLFLGLLAAGVIAWLRLRRRLRQIPGWRGQ